LKIAALFGAIGAAVAIGVVYYIANSSVQVNASIFLGFSVGFGVLLTANQVLAIISFFPWPKSINAFVGSLKVVLGSTKSISFECVLGNEATALYFPRCLAPFVCTFMIVFYFYLSRPVAMCFRSKASLIRWDFNKTINTLGQILQVFYIALAAIVVVPYECYPHPNGKEGLTQYPQVICWEGDHVPLVAMSCVVLVCFLIPFTTWCVWGTFNIVRPPPKEINRANLVRFRFMVNRFRTDCWWWNNCSIARQLLLAFTPSLPGEEPIHGMYMLGVLVLYGFGHCFYWPWKAPMFNMLDLIVGFFLIQVVSAATCVIEVNPSEPFLEYWVFASITIMYGSIGSHFLFCAYKLLGSTKGKDNAACVDGSVGLYKESVGLTDKEVIQMWMEASLQCLKYTPVQAGEIMEMMNVYDKRSLLKAISVWYSQCPGDFPCSAKFRRITGVPHTSHGEVIQRRETRTKSRNWMLEQGEEAPVDPDNVPYHLKLKHDIRKIREGEDTTKNSTQDKELLAEIDKLKAKLKAADAVGQEDLDVEVEV
jgi:hypothetical protein